MDGVSIIVCCFNSAKRLPRTLEHLSRQTGVANIHWEVILINNNSIDNTEEIAVTEWVNYKRDISLKIVNESRTGLSHARERGINEARYSYIIFCDDDNWLDEEYVRRVFEKLSANERIGVLGGCGQAVSEIDFPVWFSDLQKLYAVGPQADHEGDITDEDILIYGAGMAFPRKVWFELKDRGFFSLLEDRKGNNLSSGGDSEFCYAVKLMGYRIHYDSSLKFKHFIEPVRLTKDYYKRLEKGITESNKQLIPYAYAVNTGDFIKIRPLWLNEIARLLYAYANEIFLYIKHKRFSLKTGRLVIDVGRMVKIRGAFDKEVERIRRFSIKK